MSFLTDPAKYHYRSGSLFLGLDAHGQEVGISTERHAITVAGSRSGKGACLLIPNARRWPHNLLVVDPKGEVAAESWQAREALGQSVHVLDPFKVAEIPDRLRASFNPLQAIDPESLTAREEIRALADGLVKRSDPKNNDWYDGTVNVLAGMIAYTIETAPPALRSFAGVRRLLIAPPARLYETAQAMTDTEAFGGLAKLAGVIIQTGIDADRGMEKSHLSDAQKAIDWMGSPAFAPVFEASTFDLADLKSGKVSVFLVLPPQYLSEYGVFLRLFVRSALSAMMRDGAKVRRQCLFLLDEFAALGRLDAISTGMGLMAGYGLHLWPFLQDLGQLKALYTAEVSETFFGNVDAAVFFGNTDPATLEYISRRVGNVTPQELNISPPKAIIRGTTPTPFGAAQEADFQDAMAEYNRRTRVIGTPRLPAEKIASIIGKKNSDKVAASMLVFAKGGDLLHLALAPYFGSAAYALKSVIEPDAPLLTSGHAEAMREATAWARQRDKREHRRKALLGWGIGGGAVGGYLAQQGNIAGGLFLFVTAMLIGIWKAFRVGWWLEWNPWVWWVVIATLGGWYWLS